MYSPLIYLMCHLCVLCTMTMKLLMLFPCQEVKHQTIACYYLFPWLDVDYWPKGCNYRPSMIHLIGITMKKRSRGKNNDYKRLAGLLLFSDGLAAEWIHLPLYKCLLIKHSCLWNLTVTLHVRFRFIWVPPPHPPLTLSRWIWDFQSVF